MADGMNLPPDTPALAARLLEACEAMERALGSIEGHLDATRLTRELARHGRVLRDVRLLADLALAATPQNPEMRVVRDALAQIVVRADDVLGEGA